MLLISFIIAIGILYSLYWFHEGGHIIFGIISNLYNFHSLCIPHISNWIKVLGVLPVPQQTENCEGMGASLFFLGGILFVLIVIYFIVSILSKKFPRSKNYLYIIFLIIFLQQVLDNFLFGTDNYKGEAILFRENSLKFVTIIDILTIISLILLIMIILKKELKIKKFNFL